MSNSESSTDSIGTLAVLCAIMCFVFVISTLSVSCADSSTVDSTTEKVIIKNLLYKASGGRAEYFIISLTFEGRSYKEPYYIRSEEYQAVHHPEFLAQVDIGDTVTITHVPSTEKHRRILSFIKHGKEYINLSTADSLRRQNTVIVSVFSGILFFSIATWLLFPSVRVDYYQLCTILLLLIALLVVSNSVNCDAIAPRSYKHLWRAKQQQQRSPSLEGTPLDRLNNRRDSLQLSKDE